MKGRQTETDITEKENLPSEGWLKSKSGTEVSHLHAEMALMPGNILMNLVNNTRNQVFLAIEKVKKDRMSFSPTAPGPDCPPTDLHH